MTLITVRNLTRETELAARAELADGFWSRTIGLLGRQGLPPGGGLVLRPCTSIHTLAMRFAIDVVHTDRYGVVLRTLTDLGPWRLGPLVRGGYLVVELPSGVVQASRTQLGDRLLLEVLEPGNCIEHKTAPKRAAGGDGR